MNTSPRRTVFTGPSRPWTALTPRVFMHLVLFQMHPTATQEDRDTALHLMQAMCEGAAEVGILKYEIAESMDTRKGYILSEKVVFTDQKAFEAFKATVGHKVYADFIRQHADWIISDYEIPANLV